MAFAVQELDDNLAELTRQFEEATAAKLKCQREAEETALTISLANRLVGGLASEKVRWAESVEKFKQAEETLGTVNHSHTCSYIYAYIYLLMYGIFMNDYANVWVYTCFYV